MAHRTAPAAAPTGGSPVPFTPTGFCGSGMFSASKSSPADVKDGWRPDLVHLPAQKFAVLPIVNHVPSGDMTEPLNRTSEDLPAEVSRMQHGSDVANRGVIHDPANSCFQIQFDLGKTGVKSLSNTFAGNSSLATPIKP